jgi:hypothetical protein
MLTAEDAAVMLEAIGDVAVVNGVSFNVLFNDTAQVADYRSDQVVRVDPYCLAASADVAALGIHGDPDGTAISIGGTDYRVMAVDPDGSAFSILTLGVN